MPAFTGVASTEFVAVLIIEIEGVGKVYRGPVLQANGVVQLAMHVIADRSDVIGADHKHARSVRRSVH